MHDVVNQIIQNMYFVSHPEMVLGQMQEVSGPYGMETACIPQKGQSLESLLTAAIGQIQGEMQNVDLDDLPVEEADALPADPNVRNFSFAVVDGKLYFRENSLMDPVSVSATAEQRIRGLIGIRDCVRKLIEYQTEDYPESMIQAEQAHLNALYDSFAEKYGRINSRANSSAFSTDNAYYLLSSLEVRDSEGNFLRKADMFSKRTMGFINYHGMTAEQLAWAWIRSELLEPKRLISEPDDLYYKLLEDTIFVNSSPKRSKLFFEVLCGLRKPDAGTVTINGIDPYTLTPDLGADFRRKNIGAIPQGMGWIPELRMIDQIAFPMQAAGIGNGEILKTVKALTSELLPLDSLYNTPGRCTARKQAHAAILRAVICKPKVLVFNGFLDDLPDLDTDTLWHILWGLRPENSVLIYLSGAPAPRQIRWTQELRV